MEYTDTSTQSLFSCSVVSDSLQPQWSLPGSTAHGISQARILEQVAFSFSRVIFLIQGLNSYLLHWQVCSLSLSHQVSPIKVKQFEF